MGSRGKKFIYNSVLSFVQQLVTIICGLILPQLVLKTFGSSINGTMSSITQFLSFITLLQGGVGTVARLAYYKPLANNDQEGISIAYKTVSLFYKKFSILFCIYLAIMCVAYPIIVDTGYSFTYVASLVLILGLSSVFEYFFGQASQMLLYAAQRNYIYSVIQILCTIASTVIGVYLVKAGASIHVIKFASALIYAVRPVCLWLYVRKKFSIISKCKANNALLAQRNAALVRHIAFYIHTSTDTIVLSLFSNVLWVSVYAVHNYVISSLSRLVTSILGNTEVVFGDMIAKNECEIMDRQIPIYDLCTKILSGSCYTTCAILISRFVALYTKGVQDIDYYHPVFAALLILAEAIYCMGVTYQNVYIAAGHIHKTEWIAITEAAINLILSCVLVLQFGIIGVAIGTVTAMVFKTAANIWYMRKNVYNMSLGFIIGSFAVNIGIGIVLILLFWTVFYFEINSFSMFCIAGGLVFIIVTAAYLVVNYIFYRDMMSGVIHLFMRKFKKSR